MVDRTLPVPLLLIGVLGLAACQSGSSPNPQPAAPSGRVSAAAPTDLTPLAIVQHIAGEDPGFPSPQIFLIQSRDQLLALGSQELINHNVDFGRHTLAVIALGRQATGGYWARITAAQLQGDVLHLQGFANRPGQEQAVSQATTCPYAAIVLPKVKPAGLRSDIQSISGQMVPATR